MPSSASRPSARTRRRRRWSLPRSATRRCAPSGERIDECACGPSWRSATGPSPRPGSTWTGPPAATTSAARSPSGASGRTPTVPGAVAGHVQGPSGGVEEQVARGPAAGGDPVAQGECPAGCHRERRDRARWRLPHRVERRAVRAQGEERRRRGRGGQDAGQRAGGPVEIEPPDALAPIGDALRPVGRVRAEPQVRPFGGLPGRAYGLLEIAHGRRLYGRRRHPKPASERWSGFSGRRRRATPHAVRSDLLLR